MKKTINKIGIFIESDFFENEIFYYQQRFAEEEHFDVRFYSRLWGQEGITFKGHEFGAPFHCTESFEKLSDKEIDDFSAFIVPAGMVSDRLRYTEDVNKLPPAALFLKKLFERKHILKGIICHGLWLVSPIAEVIKNRNVACHNNLIWDARAYGANYVDKDVVVDGDLITARSGGHASQFVKEIIRQLRLKKSK